MRLFLLIVVSFYTLMACNDSELKIKKTIKTTVFSVEGTSAYQIDTIQFIEKEFFDDRDVKLEHHYYHSDESLKAKEIYEFTPGSRFAKNSTYYDEAGNKLSYYKFMYNGGGQRISSHAYDASNDELLRIERYQYNDAGKRSVKEIRNANDQLNRSFLFGYDAEGNQNSLTVADSEGKVLFREDYKIIGRDKTSNEWIEMWGFIGKTPNSCKVREITR